MRLGTASTRRAGCAPCRTCPGSAWSWACRAGIGAVRLVRPRAAGELQRPQGRRADRRVVVHCGQAVRRVPLSRRTTATTTTCGGRRSATGAPAACSWPATCRSGVTPVRRPGPRAQYPFALQAQRRVEHPARRPRGQRGQRDLPHRRCRSTGSPPTASTPTAMLLRPLGPAEVAAGGPAARRPADRRATLTADSLPGRARRIDQGDADRHQPVPDSGQRRRGNAAAPGGWTADAGRRRPRHDRRRQVGDGGGDRHAGRRHANRRAPAHRRRGRDGRQGAAVHHRLGHADRRSPRAARRHPGQHARTSSPHRTGGVRSNATAATAKRAAATAAS